jgi:hypothetical protein
MAVRKDIRPSDTITVCDVCGRTLLRGERSDHYLHGGERKLVCELCRGRAVNEGWIPEDESLGPRAQWGEGDRRRSLFGRLRGRRERVPPRAEPQPGWLDEPEPEPEPQDELDAHEEPQAAPPPPPPPPRRPAPRPPARERHVHAVPASDEMKQARALDLFNGSEHPRSVAGIARSLGPPLVVVRADRDRPSVVTIVVAWELSWYRYELDLADEAGGVRVASQGTELDELDEEERVGNAVADDGGLLALAAAH